MQALYIGLMIGFIYTFTSFSSIATAIQIIFRHGVNAGFLGGVGHASAQIVWCSIAVGAVSLGTDLLKAQLHHYRLAAALVLAAVAIKLFITASKTTKKEITNNLVKHVDSYFTVFSVAISTPSRILGYIALLVILANSFIQSATFNDKLLLIISSTLGTILWWIIFAFVIGKLKLRPSTNQLFLLQRLVGGMLMALALGVYFFPY